MPRRFSALFSGALVACLLFGMMPATAAAFGFGGGGGGILDRPGASGDGGDPDGVGLDDPEKGPRPQEVIVLTPGPTGLVKTIQLTNIIFRTWAVVIWR